MEEKTKAELTAADAAKKVARVFPVLDEDGKDTGKTKSVPVKADEVLAFAVHGDRVVVVTTDGQKLEGKL